MKSTDVLIVGGGVIGLSCALYLLQAGREVTVIERGAVGCGSSHANCGTITPSHSPPLAAPGMPFKALRWMLQADAPFRVAPRIDPALWQWMWRFSQRCNARDWMQSARAKATLLHASRSLIEGLIREHQLQCEFVADGVLYAFRDEKEFEASCGERSVLSELGIPTQLWNAAQLGEIEPALRDGLAGGLWFPGDASLRPDRYVAELARVVRGAGGTILEHCALQGFAQSGSRITAVEVRTPGSEARQIVARDVLLATGAWSPAIARQLDIRLPIQPGKGYSITYDTPALVPHRPLVLKERSVCVTSWGSGFRLGSTMEFAGFDDTLNRRRLDALERGAREYLREPIGPVKREEWFGWRPMTWDDLPILGRAPGCDNLWLATGHGMLGMSMSAVSGRMLSELICAHESVIDPTPYSPARFA